MRVGVHNLPFGCVYGVAHRELHTCAALSLQRSTYSLLRAERTYRAESIAANQDIALVDLQGVDLSP
jgi:hypothetical protein